MSTPFANKLATIAQQQYNTFKNIDEADPKLCKQIQKYWTELGFQFESCVTVAWSAVFVSWCVKQAGATITEFKFAYRHSTFVYHTILNNTNNISVFKGRKISEYAPKIGDIVINNRSGNNYDYEFAKANEKYESHSAIVVEIGQDTKGKYAITIGGNEGDSVRTKEIRLSANGKLIQRSQNPFICIIENLK